MSVWPNVRSLTLVNLGVKSDIYKFMVSQTFAYCSSYLKVLHSVIATAILLRNKVTGLGGVSDSSSRNLPVSPFDGDIILENPLTSMSARYC